MALVQTVLASRTFSDETVAYGPVPVPVGLSIIRLWIDVTQMVDPAQFFELNNDVSLDGGATWQFLSGCTRIGGIVVNSKTQLVQTQAMIQVPLPDPTNTNRQVRGTFRVVGTVPLSVTVEAV